MNIFTPYPGLTSVRPVAGDPVRGLIADVARPPKALVPAPLIQKEAPTGYSYQQINCLDSIIRCVCAQQECLSYSLYFQNPLLTKV